MWTCSRGLFATIPIKAGLPDAWLPILSSESSEWRFPGRGWWCRFARDRDWGSNGSRGCGWGGKKKDQRRGSFACPCGWGPSGQEVRNQRKPAQEDNAAQCRPPKGPQEGGSEAARLSIPSFGIDIYDLSRTSKAYTTVKDPMHDANVGVLGLQGWSTKPFVASRQEHTYQGLGSPEASYQTVLKWLNASLKDPRDHHAVASDFAFRTREMLPVPFEVSLRTIAARKVGSLRHSWRRSSATLVGWSIQARGFDCSLMRSTDVAA